MEPGLRLLQPLVFQLIQDVLSPSVQTWRFIFTFIETFLILNYNSNLIFHENFEYFLRVRVVHGYSMGLCNILTDLSSQNMF